MIFEWDEPKNRKNISEHGIDFNEALYVFGDPRHIEYRDIEHSEDEDRYIAIGSIGGRIVVLYVVFTERGDAIRLISARKATKKERRVYYASKR